MLRDCQAWNVFLFKNNILVIKCDLIPVEFGAEIPCFEFGQNISMNVKISLDLNSSCMDASLSLDR